MAATAGDHPGALAHFESAVALTRKSVGNDSLELAILLLNYGKIKAEDNVDAGLGVLGEGREILERLHDKRAATVGAVQAMILAKNKRWPEARKILEDALAHVDADTEPVTSVRSNGRSPRRWSKSGTATRSARASSRSKRNKISPKAARQRPA